MTGSLWAFLAISTLVIITPGPDTLITIRSAFIGGRAAGMATAFGVALGQLVWAVATSVGLVAVLLASEPVFNAVKWLGAAYLICLGIETMVRTLRSKAPVPHLDAHIGQRLTLGRAFRHGLISDLGNPKMAVFFASVLPQFAPQGGGMLSTLLLLGAIFAAMTLIWLVLYSLAITAVGGALQRSAVRRVLEAAMGGVLVMLGLRLAAEQR
jgi:threonine/homoserine/homoserine lactone efflux protein